MSVMDTSFSSKGPFLSLIPIYHLSMRLENELRLKETKMEFLFMMLVEGKESGIKIAGLYT